MIKKAKVKVIRGKWYREVFPEEGMGKRQWVCIHHDGKPMWNSSSGWECSPTDAAARLWEGVDADHLTFEVEIPDPKPTFKVGDTVSIQLASDGLPRYNYSRDRLELGGLTDAGWGNVTVDAVESDGGIRVVGYPACKAWWIIPGHCLREHVRPAIPAIPTPETWSFKGRLDVARVLREANYRPCVVEGDDGRFAAAFMTPFGYAAAVWCQTREQAEKAARTGAAKPQKHTVTVLE